MSFTKHRSKRRKGNPTSTESLQKLNYVSTVPVQMIKVIFPEPEPKISSWFSWCSCNFWKINISHCGIIQHYFVNEISVFFSRYRVTNQVILSINLKAAYFFGFIFNFRWPIFTILDMLIFLLENSFFIKHFEDFNQGTWKWFIQEIYN